MQAALRTALEQLHQSEILAHYDQLVASDAQAASELEHELAALDLKLLGHQLEMLGRAKSGEAEAPSSIAPGEMLALASNEFPWPLNAEAQGARELGETLLEEGKVAALLLAGGQGTRLGFDAPKGLFPIYPLSERCLFDGFCAQINTLADMHGVQPLLLIMTSDATHDVTLEVFEDMDYFGLDPDRVRFFSQARCPALSEEGKLLLESPTTLAQSPDGHGGTLTALRNSGMLDELKMQEVEWLFTFQVDNPAVSICDPHFVGLNAQRKAEASLQAVRKRDASEKVGVFGYRDGKPAIIEYSELSDEQAQERDAQGELLWAAGNCAVHVFSVEFLDRFTQAQLSDDDLLPLHLAHKVVPYMNAQGELVAPDAPNAWKFERFIFDCLPAAKGVYALEIARERSFLPVKSAAGETSPDAVRQGLMQLWRLELRRMGLAISDEQPVEISPEVWANPQELAQLIDQLKPDLQAAISDPSAALLIEE